MPPVAPGLVGLAGRPGAVRQRPKACEEASRPRSSKAACSPIRSSAPAAASASIPHDAPSEQFVVGVVDELFAQPARRHRRRGPGAEADVCRAGRDFAGRGNPQGRRCAPTRPRFRPQQAAESCQARDIKVSSCWPANCLIDDRWSMEGMAGHHQAQAGVARSTPNPLCCQPGRPARPGSVREGGALSSSRWGRRPARQAAFSRSGLDHGPACFGRQPSVDLPGRRFDLTAAASSTAAPRGGRRIFFTTGAALSDGRAAVADLPREDVPGCLRRLASTRPLARRPGRLDARGRPARWMMIAPRRCSAAARPGCRRWND